MVNFYACSDLKKTDVFYQSLGLKIFRSEPGCNIYDSGYGYLGFLQKDDMKLPDYSCISFDCENEEEVDTVYESLMDKYLCTVPQKHPKYSVYSFFLKDPDGYTVEFQYILD